MNAPLFHTAAVSGAVLHDLPVGLVHYDGESRLVFANDAYHRIVGLPPGTFEPGSRLADNAKLLAARGVFGPGDPDILAQDVLALDHSRRHRVLRRLPEGLSFEANYVPLGGGAHIVCVLDTTQFVHQRDEAENTAARLWLAMARLPQGVAVFGPDWRLTVHNAAFAELLGLSAPGVPVGTRLTGLLDLLRQQQHDAPLDPQELLRTQLALERVRASRLRWARGGQAVEIGFEPLPDGGWTVTVTNVTALADAQETERRQASQVDGMLRAIPHGICVWGADRRVAMVNRAYNEIMRGATVAIGDHYNEVMRRWAHAGELGPGDPEELAAQFTALDLSRTAQVRRQRPDGTTIDVRIAPLPDGGQIRVVTDVTSLMHAEGEASTRVAVMDAMLRSTRHGIVVWGKDRRVVAFNWIAEAVQELPPGVLIVGRKLEDMLEMLNGQGVFGPGETGKAYVEHMLGRDPGKSHRRQRVTPAGRVLDIQSDPTPDGGWIATYTDITESRNAEEALRRAKTAAESANTAKSRFLATMSHELRTPLNSVIGFSDALARTAGDGLAEPARVAEYAGAINKAGRQLLSLIDTILDVARLEAGRFDLSSDRVDIHHLVRACIRQADTAAAVAEVALTVDLPDGLPLIRGDERRLRQVLSQLLSNAIKFSDASGSVSVTVQTAPAADGEQADGKHADEKQPNEKQAGDGLLLCVVDHGIGIAADDLERVFEPFTQLDGTLSRRFQGTGLGLYIARALMRAHGGELALHSSVGQGTTAAMHFPADRLLPAQPSVQPSATRLLSLSPSSLRSSQV